MTELNIESTYHNAGQGLFYSINGRERVGGREFTVVYDCGSTTIKQIKKAIKGFEEKTERKTIDILVISHFHKDHINGLRELISRNKIIEIIIPYLHPVERIIVFAALMADSGMEFDDFSRSDVGRLVLNPVDFMEDLFKSKNASTMGNPKPKITIVITGKEEFGLELSEGTNLKNNTEKKDDSNFAFSWTKPPYRISPKLSVYDPTVFRRGNSDSSNLTVRDHSALLKINFGWIFKFFNSHDNELVKQFLEAFKKAFGDTAKNKIQENPKIFLEEHIDSVSHIYKLVFKTNVNVTSLTMLHGSDTDLEKAFGKCISVRPVGFAKGLQYCIFCLPIKAASGVKYPRYQLLTGDASFSEPILKEFKKHYGTALDNVFSGLVPHHGSGRNFSKELFEGVDSCGVWVVSFGLGNRYKHPHVDVVDFFIDQKNKELIPVNQLQTVTIEEYFLIN